MTPRTILHRTFAVCLAIAGLLAAGWASADPPSRVARLSYTQGVVSFSPAGNDDWVRALLNRPLVRGDRLWTDNDARAELQIGVGAVRLSEYTSVSLLDISNRITQFQLAQGTLSIRVRHLRRGEAIEIATPNLAFAIERPGEYLIAVDPRGEATTVVVRSGQGQVFGDGVAYELRDQETVRFYGSNLADPEFLAFDAPDPFERWARGRERRVDQAIAARYVAPEVIGYEDLDAYGSWRSVEGYGTVWTPRSVAADWAPYSTGHWSWIEPYGWTWVDDAPWGFAPYHYGRWAHLGGAWSWVPGPKTVRPVYAPALVAFVGGSNFRVSVSSGPTTSGIAWFPLAPGEVYRPAYNVTPDYFRNVNVSNTVVNNTYITNVYNQTNVTEVNYRNRQVTHAITAVPAVAFAQSQPVHKVAVPFNREAFARAPVITSLATLAPTPMSMTGGAPPAAQRPADNVLRRTAVVREAPPPVVLIAPAPQRMDVQQQVPGRSQEGPVAVRPAAPLQAPNVKVVGTETPKPMLLRSRERDGERRDAATGGASPPAAFAPTPMQPGSAPLAPRAAPATTAAQPAVPPAMLPGVDNRATPGRAQDPNERARDANQRNDRGREERRDPARSAITANPTAGAPGTQPGGAPMLQPAPQRAAPAAPAVAPPVAIMPAPAATPTPATAPPAPMRPQDANERRRDERRDDRRPAAVLPPGGDAPRAMQPVTPPPAAAPPPPVAVPAPGVAPRILPSPAPAPVAVPAPGTASPGIEPREPRDSRANPERDRRERDARRDAAPAAPPQTAPPAALPPSPGVQPRVAAPPAVAPPSAAPPVAAPVARPAPAAVAPPTPPIPAPNAAPGPQSDPNSRDAPRDRGDRERRGNQPVAPPPAPPAAAVPAATPPQPQAVAPAAAVPQSPAGAASQPTPKQDVNLQRRDRREERKDERDGDKQDGKKDK